jgi:hypothetical protein
VHLAKEFYKWFAAMRSERKHITGAYDNWKTYVFLS